MNMQNKTVIISGASRGIGRATALLLAQQGANVVATARSADDLNTLAAEHANIAVVPGDVASEADMATVVQTALDHFGRIDVVINNAGYGVFSTPPANTRRKPLWGRFVKRYGRLVLR